MGDSVQPKAAGTTAEPSDAERERSLAAAREDLERLRRSTLPPFVLVTGNRHKVVEAERILGRRLQTADVDLPEIQSDDLLEVLEAKGEEAWQRLRRPLVVEETGLELTALNGFPGPLVKWMLKAIGAPGLGRVAQQAGDAGAVACCAVLLRDGERRWVGVGRTQGLLLDRPRGEHGFGWDPVFVPRLYASGDDPGGWRTYAELGEEEKDATGHRGLAWCDLLRVLELGPEEG